MFIESNKTMYWIIGIFVALIIAGNAPYIIANSSIHLPYDRKDGEKVHKNTYQSWNEIIESVVEEGGELYLGEAFQSEQAILSQFSRDVYDSIGLPMYDNYIRQVNGRYVLEKDIYYPTTYDKGFEISKVYISIPLDSIFDNERYLVVEEVYKGEDEHLKNFKRKNYYKEDQEGIWIYDSQEGVSTYHEENVAWEYLHARGIIE
ncbi:hypothetical protein [Niameybacter massiliensis]|uniref:hypothetical protein n=1 Tax=Niameybacter massiliensis TaxID=1658108 RepID=UPI0006B4177B|nr:hypothetical protein [Niameybacter massiliensis]